MIPAPGQTVPRGTVHQLLSYLEDCFLVRTVWMEGTSERQRMVNPRKAYPVDPGLIPLFDRTGRANTGHALETAVLVELERRRLEVTYLKTAEGHEVDFSVREPGGATELIQVCSDPADPETTERDVRSLVEAGKRFPKSPRRLLTLTRDIAPGNVPTEVVVQPAYEWMLAT